MECINELPDDLLLKILSLLPAKDVVATMVLSKRWQFLWMMVPKLFYHDNYQDIEYGTFSRFVDRSLFLQEAPVLETLHFKPGKTCGVEDIRNCVRADKCSPPELITEFDSSSSLYPAVLPKSLYTGGRMLVTLKLNNVILVDVIDSLVSFPSLRTLVLLSVKYPDDEFVKRLLSNCPVLEALVVDRTSDDNVTIFTVTAPSLKSLFLRLSPNFVYDGARGFVIDAPSLEFLDIVDYKSGFCIFENNMPDIVKAHVDVLTVHPGKILSSIASVKRLFLCSGPLEDAYPDGCVFHGLVHLKICTCGTEWLNLLMCLLRDSPKLQSLKLEQCHPLRDEEPRPYWINPSYVPESILSSLQTLEWLKYEGSKEERELVAFILRTGSNLKNVIISSLSTDLAKQIEMVDALSLMTRRSPMCGVAFNY